MLTSSSLGKAQAFISCIVECQPLFLSFEIIMGFEIFRSSCKCFFSDKDFGLSSYYSFLIPDEISPKQKVRTEDVIKSIKTHTLELTQCIRWRNSTSWDTWADLMDPLQQSEPPFESTEVSGWLICLTESCIGFLLHQPTSLAMASRARAVFVACMYSTNTAENPCWYWVA